MAFRIILALLALAAGGGARAYTYVFPRDGLSSADEAFVLFVDSCGDPHLDPSHPPSVRRDGSTIGVDIYVVPSLEVCFSAGPPPILLPIALGRFPRGGYTVRTREIVSNENEFRVLHLDWQELRVRDTPNRAVSGTWFDAEHPGAGVVVNLVDTPGEPEPRAFVVVATLDADGRPAWYTGVGSFADARLDVALTLGGDAAPSRRGTFTYDGCGRARFQVDDPTLRFPIGDAPLRQLTAIPGLLPCEPPTYFPLEWH